MTTHILGFPRIGAHREFKKALEKYWKGLISKAELEESGRQIKQANWQIQAEQQLSYITVGDFSWYDHVLDTSSLFGVVPERFNHTQNLVDLDTVFCMARGSAPNKPDTIACEMTKWFNTNYHYIVPELNKNQTFNLSSNTLFSDIEQAKNSGYKVKPVILGPLTYLYLSKIKGGEFNKLDLLPALIKCYNQLLAKLATYDLDWIQIDEPILTLDLDSEYKKAFAFAYSNLHFGKLKSLLTTYFGAIGNNWETVIQLPVDGLHIDICSVPDQLAHIIAHWPENKVLSVGAINGRNIWKADFDTIVASLTTAKEKYKDKLWIGSSCSLIHTPVDLDHETHLDTDIKNWLAFAKQKVEEIALLDQILSGKHTPEIALKQKLNRNAINSRNISNKVHKESVKARTENIPADFAIRNNPYNVRAKTQYEGLHLPLFPTTTIGSFPQTQDIRQIRLDYKVKKINKDEYNLKIKQHIAQTIALQEALGLDVIVHGEAERNDMVEYFGELLDGFAFTANGWVQSYGSRCVKPPVIYGDVSRPKEMTVPWTKYAQSLTKKLVKGMLTGPITILSWSFVRDDQPHAKTALQIALAIRDEVIDLEKAGIHIIQIDEPAFREALPLRKQDQHAYLDWAVKAFKISSSGVQDKTQIHTHMCYSEFNDVIAAIASLDADVITIENSRSDMELLCAFKDFAYPNEIGPGVYDIHSPRIPETDEIVNQLESILNYIPVSRLWVNPDCGLKTRNYQEVTVALTNMVSAAKILRDKYHA